MSGFKNRFPAALQALYDGDAEAFFAEQIQAPPHSHGPSRAPADPPPTVSVAFRVIRKAKTAAAPAAASDRASDAGNNGANNNDGWDSPSNDDW